MQWGGAEFHENASIFEEVRAKSHYFSKKDGIQKIAFAPVAAQMLPTRGNIWTLDKTVGCGYFFPIRNYLRSLQTGSWSRETLMFLVMYSRATMMK